VRGSNREANMRLYFVWLVSAAAAMAVSVNTAGVSTAMAGARPSSMPFHPRLPSFRQPAPSSHSEAPFAGQHHERDARDQKERDREEDRLRRRRTAHGFVYPGYYSYADYPYDYGYGSGAPEPAYDAPGPLYYERVYMPPAGASSYTVEPYRVAPSAKIIHLMPKE
jgi:hypothetical protein